MVQVGFTVHTCTLSTSTRYGAYVSVLNTDVPGHQLITVLVQVALFKLVIAYRWFVQEVTYSVTSTGTGTVCTRTFQDC